MKTEFKERIEIKKTPDQLKKEDKIKAPENPADKLKKIDIKQER